MSILLQTLDLLPFNCLPVKLKFSIKANYTTAIISSPTPDIMFQKDTRKLNISPKGYARLQGCVKFTFNHERIGTL